jgi:predicted amino acid racemase
MAIITLYRDRLRHNYRVLDELFRSNGIEWGVVTKLLCGTEEYIKEVIALGARQIHDSRVSNLEIVKELRPDIQTVYIKPPPQRSIEEIVRFADVSLNTELSTINALSEEAVRQDKLHKVLIMIEMGDLREGVLGENLVDFYERVFHLPKIEIVGLGTNLNCLHGVMPTQDKLVQLSLYKQLIEAKFNRKIPWISGGTSVTIPLLYRKQIPAACNHFRVGETLFFGLDLFTGELLEGMEPDVFEMQAEIIEMTQKPVVPIGPLGVNPSGETFEVEESLYGKTTWRAILDVGLLDIHPEFMAPSDERIGYVGASSDMLIYDLGDNDANYKVGDLISFKLKYMGALRLLNSDYIDKRVV